jgi:hypothetical protein
MGETIEDLLDRQKRAGKEQYRTAVGQVWTDNKVDDAEADRLGALQSELGLNTTTAADIEREVTGDTVQAILQRQTREVEARQRHLDELYNQARRLYTAEFMMVDPHLRTHSGRTTPKRPAS